MASTQEMTVFEEDANKTISMTRKIGVLVVDDHSGVRAGIKNLLQSTKDMVVVGEGENGAQAFELVNTKKPDILLLDIELPDQRGDIVMHRIHRIQPETKVLAVSSYSDREYILSMLENGASGYITKDEAPMMLLDAIRSIVRTGKKWFSPQVLKNSGLSAIEEQTLTAREIDILRQLILDRSASQIASSLEMKEDQVEKYLKLLMMKFETKSLNALREIGARILSRRTPR